MYFPSELRINHASVLFLRQEVQTVIHDPMWLTNETLLLSYISGECFFSPKLTLAC
jgi:hypothetical protein